MEATCTECGARHADGLTCQDDFYQMLYWENEDAELGIVHHLLVLCYHLQHPHLYSAAGLKEARRLLDDFLQQGLSTEDVRRSNRQRLDSGKRTFHIKSKTNDQGQYTSLPVWTMTAADVVAAGPQNYISQVQAWARSIHNSLSQESL